MLKTACIILLIACLTAVVFGQTSTDYFPLSAVEKKKWESCEAAIAELEATPSVKADTLLAYAQLAYEAQLYDRTRTWCEAALALAPDLGDAHYLIGKAYVSSYGLCKDQPGRFAKLPGAVIWAAFDEWEQALTKSTTKTEQIKVLLERYHQFLPTEEDLKRCFTNNTWQAGDRFPVGCWIQRAAKIRFYR